MSQHVGRGLLCAAVGLLWPMAALAQVSIEPPPSPPAGAPAPTPAPEPQIQPPPPTPSPSPAPTPAPETDATPRPSSATPPAPSATEPSAQSVLENLLSTRPSAAAPPPQTPPAGATSGADIQGNAVAPDEPTVKRKAEGDFVWRAVGRLTRDDKSGQWLFVFDSDGKNMQDPPMGVIPSHMLMEMQQASKNGTLPTKFRVSGEVTEYNGKNYLYVKDEQVVQDLNQGVGG
ncbi:MAG TPA: hypothetical protein VH253_03820 [Phycisphaerae bacterium]|nr:hypothetical protein [Phycisphaerae bacterium]